MKYLLCSIILVFSFLSFAKPVLADEYVVSSSAKINKPEISINQLDYRVWVLEDFLSKHHSPMAEYATDLVYYADKYEIDWRLVPAIAGVESTFGKKIPVNSYNAYGWNNGNYYFNSWSDSIEVVSKALRENYYDNGAITINQIAHRYAPPSQTWSWKVKYFMTEIDSLPLRFTL